MEKEEVERETCWCICQNATANDVAKRRRRRMTSCDEESRQ